MSTSSASNAGTVGIIGAGAAGLVTAQILLKDGFDVRIITRDKSVGGVWARERVYPGLIINNVHGEFRFSSLPMAPPLKAEESGGRLTGEDMCAYMENFASTFLEGKLSLETEVLGIRRSPSGSWAVTVENRQSGAREVLEFSRIVLCTGGCSSPNIPEYISPAQAERARFRGPVLHSTNFRDHLDSVLEKKESEAGESADSSVVIAGGGKSAQE
ncbi:hypothetical protein DXG03_001125 [Asterophora parasitica]|uniref:FAD/NAD(P)-binding domain-containing protein n=1 Tax=Asterophora parasitica TaxID=117018 RepID=A0A9P7GH09_9AGAR|nr:hypothetical protein DXG03_001125 [Asterophora parasitica]